MILNKSKLISCINYPKLNCTASKMLTLAEFLQKKENQEIIVNKIIEKFRANGEWGKHGLFAEIGRKAGFSPAYVGQVFNGHKPIRESFVEKIADYLGVSVEWLRRGTDVIDNEAGDNIDSLLHDEIVEIVNEILEKNPLSFPSEKKDKLIVVLYELYIGKKVDSLSMKKEIKRFLKVM
jgi:transcriptional regulator with XRE-family HTH domain